MPNTIPSFDFASRAKVTRKTLERLASFSKIQSPSESNPLLDKTLAKINGFVKLLDSSILTAEFAYQFAAAAMVACDKERVGTAMDDLSALASKGSDTAQEVATGFKEIDQAIYKIAASTKDNMLVIQISPDSIQTATVNKHLKDVGTDLVGNLKLFAQFSRAAEEIAEWWASVKHEVVSDIPVLPHLSTSGSKPGEDDDQLALWSTMKVNLWEYYTIVNEAQVRFPDLLDTSIAAWQSAASARDPKNQPREEPDQQQTSSKRAKSIRRLLSRFYNLEKRLGNVKVKARSDNQGKEAEVSSKASGDVPGKSAPRSSDSLPAQHGPDTKAKIQAFFKSCVSAGPICK